MNACLLFSILFLSTIDLSYCKLQKKFLMRFKSSDYINKFIAEIINDDIFISVFTNINTYIYRYSKNNNNFILDSQYDWYFKRKYYNINEYISMHIKGFYWADINLDYKNNNETIFLNNLYGYYYADFFSLKDRSLCFVAQGGELKLEKYNYPSLELAQSNNDVNIFLKDTAFNLIYCSNKLLMIIATKKQLYTIIFNEFLIKISTKTIFEEEMSEYPSISNLDKKQNNVIICNYLSNSNGYFCVSLKFEGEELIVGEKFRIFNKCEPIYSSRTNFDMNLLEDNKIAAVCISKDYFYLSTINFDGESFHFDSFNNYKLIPNDGFDIPKLVTNQNYKLILFVISSQINKTLYELNLFQYCKSIIIENIEPNKKIHINFTDYVQDGIDGAIEELYLYTDNTKINIYKGEKNEYVNTKFKINDKIYVECEDSEKPLTLFYGFNNNICMITLKTKKHFIKIVEDIYQCEINKNYKNINNIKSFELEQKRINLLESNKFNFNIEFENELDSNYDFYFLHQKLNCIKSNYQIGCKLTLPQKTSKMYQGNNYIYSKLSCLNLLKVGKVNLIDDYIIKIYKADNLTKITYDINKKCNPKEKIKDFSIDMISYYVWFASFGYCDDNYIASGNCCKKQILKNWKVIEHKEYVKKYFEGIRNIYKSIISKLKKDISSDYNFDKYFDKYIINFSVLKSDEYKKFIFCFPGTTSFIQLLEEIIKSKFVSYFKNKDIKVNEYFYEIFQLIYNDVFSKEIINNLKSNPEYQIIFIGHSLGGAISTLISYYYAKESLSSNEPVLITFGQPRVGDINFSKDYMKLIPLVFRIAREEDIITRIPLVKKESLKIYDLSKALLKQNKQSTKIKQSIIEEYIKEYILNQIGYKLMSTFQVQYDYCHIGGLYLLKDTTFYHCSDFYNEETGHPICRNLALSDIKQFDRIFEYHNYLNLADNIMNKCQKNKHLVLYN